MWKCAWIRSVPYVYFVPYAYHRVLFFEGHKFHGFHGFWDFHEICFAENSISCKFMCIVKGAPNVIL